jgi:hypothetical protein
VKSIRKSFSTPVHCGTSRCVDSAEAHLFLTADIGNLVRDLETCASEGLNAGCDFTEVSRGQEQDDNKPALQLFSFLPRGSLCEWAAG